MAAVKLMVLYRRPDDEAAFWAHYQTVHLPLVAKIPGLERCTVNRVEKTLIGETAPFVITELRFADQAAFDTAMASPENRTAGQDAMSFAPGLFTLVVASEA
jgi:uncharacterized protein (TIGR02118 family)